MSKNSKIEWTHHTFNPWWGCSKVSEACRNCYAETFAKRTGRTNLWSGGRMKTKGPWKDVLKWDKSARERGVRERLFVASMSDIFENYQTIKNKEVRDNIDEWRNNAFDLLDQLTNLDVLLLTKRIGYAAGYLYDRYGKDIPKHFWIGTTVENQKSANQRIPILNGIPASVRFLSCEPLLGPINLLETSAYQIIQPNGIPSSFWISSIDWIIVGGESGPGCRYMNIDWVRNIKKQCRESNTAFFMKQLSQKGNHKTYKDFENFPIDIQVRDFPKESFYKKGVK